MVLVFLGIQVHGQCIINGSISNSAGEPVAFANALLLTANDSVLVKGTVASKDGLYQLTGIMPGNYLLKLSMLGYREKYKTPVIISVTDKEIHLGEDFLEEALEELDEVLVEAKRPLFEQQIDRLVVNVQKSITSVGGTALDVLEKAPGITVNRQNGSLSMGGKAGVLVMTNGKLNRLPLEAVMQILSGMNAASIDKIELITSPPAKYDAEGDAGIINIVLKENPNFGTNASLSLTGGYGDGEKTIAAVNLNRRTKKRNLYGDFSFNRNNTSSLLHNSRTLEHQGEIITTSINSVRDPVETNLMGRLGLDFYLGEKTEVGAGVSGFNRLWTMDAYNTSTITSSTGRLDIIDINLEEKNHLWNLSGKLYLSHNFNENNILSFNLDYRYYKNDNPSNYINEYFQSQDQDYLKEQIEVRKRTPMELWVGSIDYSFEIEDDILVEVGAKASASRFTNDVSVQSNSGDQWVINSELTSLHELREEIGATYASFRTKISPGVDLNAGIRYEYTQSKLDSEDDQGLVDRKYGEFFPNFALATKIGEDHNLIFSFSRRITRPTFGDMAPFVIFLDPYTFFSGNTAIQPAFTNQVKLDYSFKKFLLSLQYSHDKNPIARFQAKVDPATNIQTSGSENLDFIKTYTTNILLPVSIGEFWEMENNILGYHQTMETVLSQTRIQQDLFSLEIKNTQRFILPRNYTVEISSSYSSPAIRGVFEMESRGFVDAAVQKKFKENRGVFTLSFKDIFWTNTGRFKGNVPEQNLSMYGEYFAEPRVLLLTYSRSFGNKKLKPIKDKTGAEEERKRIE